MMVDVSTDGLIQAVKEWGKEKGLNDPVMQFAKFIEEAGELAHEITRGNCGGATSVPSKETVDAVGDILVTLIIWCSIVGLDPVGCLFTAYDEIKNRTGKTVNGSFIKDNQ